MSSFISENELIKIGFKSIGNGVHISKYATFYNPSSISIGSNVRIDDFCILSGSITIGNNVHISAGTFLFAGDSLIKIGNHTSISSRCGIYAISDDFSGYYLVGSIEDSDSRHVIKEEVSIEDYVVVGTGSTILPGSNLKTGVAVGAMSLVKGTLDEWGIYCGIPCVRVKERVKIESRFIK